MNAEEAAVARQMRSEVVYFREHLRPSGGLVPALSVAATFNEFYSLGLIDVRLPQRNHAFNGVEYVEGTSREALRAQADRTFERLRRQLVDQACTHEQAQQEQEAS